MAMQPEAWRFDLARAWHGMVIIEPGLARPGEQVMPGLHPRQATRPRDSRLE